MLSALTRRLALLTTTAAIGAALPGLPAAAQTFDDGQTTAIEQIVRDYLIAHPEIIVEALDAYQLRQAEAERAAQAQALVERRDQILYSEGSPVIGNPDGDVTLVEFFDYQCGYCKRAQPDIVRLIDEDGGLRVVMKEFPILGPASVVAARASLAARNQDLYEELHNALMEFRGQRTDEIIYQKAEEVGLDLARLKADMEHPSVVDELRANMELAEALGVDGTPAFVVNQEIVPGAVGYEALKALIDADRAS